MDSIKRSFDKLFKRSSINESYCASFRKIKTVASITRTELLEHPLVLLLMIVAIGMTLLTPLFQFQQFSEDGRLARDCGLASFFLFGTFLVVECAVITIASEIRKGIASVTLIKPLSRGKWLIGKYCGIIQVLVCFSVAEIAAILLAECFSPHYRTLGSYVNVSLCVASFSAVGIALLVGAIGNRFFNSRFATMVTMSLGPSLLMVLAMSDWLEPQVALHGATAWCGVLIFFALAQILAIATLFSTRLNDSGILVLSLLWVPVGFVMGVPDFQLFWQCDALGFAGIPLRYVGGCALYACLSVSLFLGLSVRCFAKRDLG